MLLDEISTKERQFEQPKWVRLLAILEVIGVIFFLYNYIDFLGKRETFFIESLSLWYLCIFIASIVFSIGFALCALWGGYSLLFGNFRSGLRYSLISFIVQIPVLGVSSLSYKFFMGMYGFASVYISKADEVFSYGGQVGFGASWVSLDKLLFDGYLMGVNVVALSVVILLRSVQIKHEKNSAT